jgi:chloramphenicol 3-O-phosphotransferase
MSQTQDIKQGRIILLSGPIGAGKTTVARELVSQAVQPTIYIEGDVFWSFIKKPADDGVSGKRFRMIMRSMTLAARPFASEGYDVIVDFSFPPKFLEYAKKALKESPLYFVVLMPSEAICAERAAKRSEGVFSDYTEAQKLFSLFDPSSPSVFNNETTSPSDTASKIHAMLSEGIFKVSLQDTV